MKVGYSRIRLFVFLIAFAMFFSSLPRMLTPGDIFNGNDVFAQIDRNNIPGSPTGSNVSEKVASIVLADDFDDYQDLSDGTYGVEHFKNIGFTVNFELPDGEIKNGDFIIVDWPGVGDKLANFTPNPKEVPLIAEDGANYGSAILTDQGAVIIFNEKVEQNSDVKGYVKIWGRIKKNNNKEEEPDVFTITTTSKTLTFKVYPSGDTVGGTELLDKQGMYDGDHDVLDWTLNINEKAENGFSGNTVIEDKLGINQEMIGNARLYVYEKKSDGNWLTVDDYAETLNDTTPYSIDGEDYTSYRDFFKKNVEDNDEGLSYEVIKDLPIAFLYYDKNHDKSDMGHTWINDNSGYVVWSFNNDSPDHYLYIHDLIGAKLEYDQENIKFTIPEDLMNNNLLKLSYVTRITDSGMQVTYDNYAKMTYKKDGKDDETESPAEAEYHGSEAGIQGIPYNAIQVKKILSPAGTALKGIYFEVTKVGDDSYLRHIVSNEDGIARLTKLKPGDKYLVREMTEAEAKAAGYADASYPANLKIDTEAREVTVNTDPTGQGIEILWENAIDNTPETIKIAGNKTWDDENDKDGSRPSSITINLMNGTTKVDSKTVTESDGWKWTFDNLPKYDSKGDEISYTISEDAVAGYTTTVNGYNVTNKHVPENLKNPLLRVTKEAVDLPRHIYPGDEIKYLIRVTNTGDGDANEILVMDIMGDNLEYVEDDSEGTPEGQKVSWVVDIPAGKTKDIYITCRVKEGATGSVTNEVEISGIEDEYIESEFASDVEVLGEYEEMETHVLPTVKPTAKPTEDKKSPEVKAVKTVDTGDESYLMIWIMILVSAISAVTYIRFRRNK